jgi:sugar-phosphate isomerases, RpiB/LacA/LacB family
MKIAIGSDRCGFLYKERLKKHMTDCGIEPVDVGTYEEVPSDSPYFAAKAARLVASGECEFGVLICATGTGMEIAANKIKGVMCAVGYSDTVTRMAREHNNCNMIAFGQDHMGYKDVENRFDIFLSTEFSGLKHQAARTQMIRDLEEGKEIALQPIINNNWKK